MQKHGENGLACAKFLESNPRVAKVSFPGLPSHPQHELFKRIARAMSGMCCFYIKGNLENVRCAIVDTSATICKEIDLKNFIIEFRLG